MAEGILLPRPPSLACVLGDEETLEIFPVLSKVVLRVRLGAAKESYINSAFVTTASAGASRVQLAARQGVSQMEYS